MRRRILLLAVGMTTLVVLAFAIPLALLIRHNAYQDGVRALTEETNRIFTFLREEETAPTSAQITNYLASLPSSRAASVELPSGKMLGRRPPGGTLPALPPGGPGDGGGPGEGGGGDGRDRGAPTGPALTAWHGGQLAQLRVASPDGQYVVRVYSSSSTLYESENDWFLLLAGTAVALLLLGVVAGEVLTRRIVRPLAETARTAQQLSKGDTTARAPTEGPEEVAEVGRALNRLADRIDELIAEERETVADLSHRLRTPLTALRLDAEALQDPAEAERMSGHATTLERMLTAVIRAARRPQREGRLPSCDATAVVGERVAFWSALTDEQERPTTVTLPKEPLAVRCSAEDLAAAVDALLENVVAHTPEGTPFRVQLTARTPAGACLEVSDDGPGLPPDALVRGRSDRGSSGLGLDIARRCAESSGGTLTLDTSPSGGALIVLDLGAP